MDRGAYDEKVEEAVAERALSLWGEIPVNRTCEDAGIDEQWCVCHLQEPLQTSEPKVVSMATTLVGILNKRLTRFRHLCAILSLITVLDARVLLSRAPEKVVGYRLSVLVSPSGAIFEATLRLVDGDHSVQLLGEVSRINKYKGQGKCMGSVELRKICFCTSSSIERSSPIEVATSFASVGVERNAAKHQQFPRRRRAPRLPHPKLMRSA
ncbi:hypothetical protein HPB50_006734 [Hyalomma asiaticum]|uniref:Uncharacterized protein n=1 Tax=Hyalomma asiaticum TaxID=266040 RepID=A0ACB7SVP1_HYAAI|nr:hypothetical protein HPB50_006734 [Hyalomma asiaticum]